MIFQSTSEGKVAVIDGYSGMDFNFDLNNIVILMDYCAIGFGRVLYDILT